jgi:hypothetical protein
MAVTVEFGGDLQVGRVVRLGGAPHDATAEGQRLGRGTGADERIESSVKVGLQFDTRGDGARHGSPPCEQVMAVALQDMMPTGPPLG